MIHNLTELSMIGRHEDYPLDGNYALANDIDASESRNMNDGEGFNPIGRVWNDYFEIFVGESFTGTFDGRGRVISNLFINRSGEDQRFNGLFSSVMGGKITGLGLVDVDITGNGWVGALAGSLSSGTVVDCYSTGKVNGSLSVGNLGTAVGGLLGSMQASTLRNSYYVGTVSNEEHGGIGGLVGYAVHDNEGNTIIGCHFRGDVIGIPPGGLACFNAEGIITNSYFAGTVNGSVHYIGGLVGDATGSSMSMGTVTNSYWDTDIFGLNNGDNGMGTGLSGAAMRQQSSYIGWDFANVWAIDPAGVINNGYPYLQAVPPSSFPPSPSSDVASIATPVLAKSRAGSFTLGPNPVNSSGGVLNFFWDGAAINSGTLSVYNSSGNFVSSIDIKDTDSQTKRLSLSGAGGYVNRQIGFWNIVDRGSRKLPAGSYLVKGVIVTEDGGRKKVSVVIGVR